MVDFRARYNPESNNQALIQAMKAKAGQQNPLSAAIQGGMSGIEKGLQMSETLGKIKADKEKKARIAEFLKSPESEEVRGMLGGAAEFVPPEKLGQLVAEMKLKKASNETDDLYRAERTKKTSQENEMSAIENSLLQKVLSGATLSSGERAFLDERQKKKFMEQYMRDSFGDTSGAIGGEATGGGAGAPKIPGLRIKK